MRKWQTINSVFQRYWKHLIRMCSMQSTNNRIDTVECVDLKVIEPYTQNMNKSILVTELWTFHQKPNTMALQDQFGNHHKMKAYLHIFT
jgi:hypothetical protein